MLKLMFESVMVPVVLQVLSWTVSIGVKDLTALHELTLVHLCEEEGMSKVPPL